MILCIDVGNTVITGGVFNNENLVCNFQYATPLLGSADQLSLFLVQHLQSKNILLEDISDVALCSVVPSCEKMLRDSLDASFKSNLFILQAGVKTGLNIKYKNPQDVGSDKIANAIGAVNALPNKNLIIIDMSTATSICAIDKNKNYLGGTIIAGLQISMESLKNNAAKLMEVEIGKPTSYLGTHVKESIQAGLYYGHLGALKEIVNGMKKETFNSSDVTVIGTGIFSHLYNDEILFNIKLPHLSLEGLRIVFNYAFKNNQFPREGERNGNVNILPV